MSSIRDGRTAGQGTLPEYTLRVSERARRVRLVMRNEGLEVVIPSGFDRRRLPELLEAKRNWIVRAGRELEARRLRLAEQPPRLPNSIDLVALREVWSVEYRSPSSRRKTKITNSPTVRVREADGQRLVVTGDRTDFEGCRTALCRWLSRRAREKLVSRLAFLAQEHGLKYNKVSVRQQRTRWGSCSRQGNISLNARLLLLPAEAVDYVLLHELCHTRRMDHSSAFWELLEHQDPEYVMHRRLVRESAKALPTWLDHEPQGFDM